MTVVGRVSLGLALGAWSVLMLWLAYDGGIRHDYVDYLKQWQLVLDGADPWATTNAYGPLHNLFAYLVQFGLLTPKIVGVALLLAANAALVMELARLRSAEWLPIYLLSIPTNFLVVSFAVIYGLNDGVVAGLVVFAVILRFRNLDTLAGVLLGAAVLLKLYPLLLVAFIALDGRRLRWPLILAALATVALGLLAAYVVWGDAFVKAMIFGVDRPAKLMSILFALSVSPFDGPLVQFLIEKNAYVVVAVAGLVFAWAWWRRVDWLEASVVALLAILATYKVGHQQFFIPWLFLVAALPLVRSRSADALALAALLMVLFLSLYQYGYAYLSDWYRNVLGDVRTYGGFVAFPMEIAVLVMWGVFRARTFRHLSMPGVRSEPGAMRAP